MFAMTSAPDILAPYLVHFTTKPNAIESVQIYEKCLNDIQIDFTERLTMLRQQLDDVSVRYARRVCAHEIFEIWFDIFKSSARTKSTPKNCDLQVQSEMECLKKCLNMYENELDTKDYEHYVKQRYGLCGTLCSLNTKIWMDLFPFSRCYPFFFFTLCLIFSHDLEVTESVLQQRIGHIECEYQQKYNDAKEHLKNDTRLTVDLIVQHDGKCANQWNE